jgi:hypothetical protein
MRNKRNNSFLLVLIMGVATVIKTLFELIMVATDAFYDLSVFFSGIGSRVEKSRVRVV